MSKIATYSLADSPLQLSDRLIGTEAPRPIPSSTPLATKNFSLGELLQLFSSNFPAASLQAVLNTGNTATQNITLTGTITSSVIKPDEIEDAVGSQGAEFQFLSKAASGINWVDLPVYIPTLNEVLSIGNISILDAKIGELYLWDNFTPSGYAKIYANKNRINFEGKSGVSFGYIGLDTFAFLDNSVYSFQIKKPTVLSNNHTAFLQNTSGTIAYLGDIPTPISLTTIGDSGPATLIGSVLNIPEYAGGGSSYTFSSPLSESLGVVSISQASTISDGYLSLTDFNTFNNKQGTITLTTIGSSGPATFVSNVLNVPEYTLSSLGGVPYIGATQNVDLGEYELKAGQLTLDISPTGIASVGTTQWNNTIGSSQTLLKGGNVLLKNGVDLVARVVNKVTPNATLLRSNYQAVRISGAQGQRLAVAYAQANNDNNSADTIGLVCENISTNQEGFIITVGQLEEINTTGSLQGETWSDGDVLYLSPTTAGKLTNIKPTGATGHIVVMGYVEYSHAIHGKMYVKIMNGWELDELHNVYISSPANNEVLAYNSSNQLWENKTITEVTGTYNVKITTPTTPVSGTLSETQLLRLEIPPNSFAANDVLNIPSVMVSKVGTVASYSLRVKLSTSSTMPIGSTDAIVILSIGNTNIYTKLSRGYFISGGFLRGLGISNSLTDTINSIVALSVKSLDTTVTNYLYVSYQAASTADSYSLTGLQINNL
jgi:hypothetical protein